MSGSKKSGRGARATLVVLGAMMLGTMSGCLGCGGGNYLRMELDRQSQSGKAVWVGVYLLSKDNALDSRENADLTAKDAPKNFTAADGVVDSETRAVYAGDPPITITREKLDKSVTTVLVVANLPKATACARQKIALKGGSLELKLTVEDKCLVVKEQKD